MTPNFHSSYTFDGDEETRTTDRGAPNGSATAVVDGTRTVEIRNAAGTIIDSETRDIVSNLVLNSFLVTEIDHLGRATEISYGDGTEESRTYGENCCGGGLVDLTDRQGIQTTYSYDLLGRRISETRLGITILTDYDAAGRSIRTTRESSSGSQILSETDYSLDGQVVAQRTPAPHTTGLVTALYSRSYPSSEAIDPDGIGLIEAITRPDGSTEIRSFYPDGQPLAVSGTGTAPLAYVYGIWSDSSGSGPRTREIRIGESGSDDEWTEFRHRMGLLESTHFPSGAFATMTYTPAGQLKTRTDPDDIVTEFTYDGRGRQKAQIIAPGTALERRTELEYEVATVDAHVVERTITKVYDGSSMVVVGIDERSANGRRQSSTRNGLTSSTETSLPLAGDWTVTSSTPGGATTIQTYEDGLLAEVEHPGGRVETYTYDTHNRVATVTDSRTGMTSFIYTATDQVLTTTAPDPDGVLGPLLTTFTYDSMGRQIEVEHPDAKSDHFEYDLRGNLRKQYGTSYPVEYTYDPQGRRTTMTTWQNFAGDSGKATTTWEYNPERGWLSLKKDNANKGPSYTYTPAGRLASRTWARGIETRYAYNFAGDLLAVYYDDSGATPGVVYSYATTGQRSGVADGTFASAPFDAGAILSTPPALTSTRFTHTYTPDPATLLPDTEAVSGLLDATAILTRTYEDGSGATVLNRPSGFEIGTSSDSDAYGKAVHKYDSIGRLSTVSDGADTFTYKYLKLVEQSPEESYNLLEKVEGPVHDVTIAYQPGRDVMASIENKLSISPNSVISHYEYNYDKRARRTTREQSSPAHTLATKDTFTYDDLGQVLSSANNTLTGSAFNPTYSYDDIGNRSGNNVDFAGTTSYSQNLLNQYSAIATASPTYDDDGNMTSDGTWTFVWDGENRLVEASNGTTTVAYSYDYRGRQVLRDDGSDVTASLYDDWNRVAIFTVLPSSFSLQTSLLWGLDLSGSLQGAGGVGGLLKEGDLYPLYDANGNVTEKLDDTGAIAMAVTYDPFGNIVAGTLAGEYGFSTKPMDGATGMYYYGYRFYNPETGRWPNRDPIGERGGINLYAMVKNSPLNFVDILGLSEEPAWKTCCSKEKLEEAINEGSKKAAILTSKPEGSGSRIWYREYCGIVCCNAKTGSVYSTEPHKGSDPAGWTLISGVHTPGLVSCNPQREYIGNGRYGKEIKCKTGYTMVAGFHSHPPNSFGFSDKDIEWVNHPDINMPLGLGVLNTQDNSVSTTTQYPEK